MVAVNLKVGGIIKLAGNKRTGREAWFLSFIYALRTFAAGGENKLRRRKLSQVAAFNAHGLGHGQDNL